MSENMMAANGTHLLKPASNDYPIHELLKNRWSPRAFAPQPVEAEKLLSLFEAARWSPSGGNVQPWAFIVATQDDAESFSKIADALAAGNQAWAKRVPVLVATVTKREYKPGIDSPFAGYDLGQAVAHLSVQASALGLVVHQMGGFDKAKIREAFNVPEGFDIITVVAIGYQGHWADLPEALHEREQEGRTRKPLSEFVFGRSWGEPLSVTATEQSASNTR